MSSPFRKYREKVEQWLGRGIYPEELRLLREYYVAGYHPRRVAEIFRSELQS